MSEQVRPLSPPERLAKNVERFVSVVLLFVLFVLLLVQVISRYVFQNPLSWTEEVARYTFVWLVFMSAAYLSVTNSHIAVSFLTDKMSPRAQDRLQRLSGLIVFLACGVVALFSIRFVVATRILAAPASGIPVALLYLGGCLGLGLIALHSLRTLFFGVEDDGDLQDTVEAVV
ncbi:TRAP transporter small permease [Corynebacterium riegelii]|uniref:TRAP transporter small permease n=1 Tax=Corynebacterium riegelii TaxID=156976 RepID=UPI00288B7831|nr:TRAP transporter small permease [Corynebacterium riegelii]